MRIAALNGAVTRQDVEPRYAASICAMVSAEACAPTRPALTLRPPRHFWLAWLRLPRHLQPPQP